jgi:hypothetical protein
MLFDILVLFMYIYLYICISIFCFWDKSPQDLNSLFLKKSIISYLFVYEKKKYIRKTSFLYETEKRRSTSFKI